MSDELVDIKVFKWVADEIEKKRKLYGKIDQLGYGEMKELNFWDDDEQRSYYIRDAGLAFDELTNAKNQMTTSIDSDILHVITENHGMVSRTSLIRALRKYVVRDLDTSLSMLKLRGDIDIKEIKTGGRTALIYQFPI